MDTRGHAAAVALPVLPGFVWLLFLHKMTLAELVKGCTVPYTLLRGCVSSSSYTYTHTHPPQVISLSLHTHTHTPQVISLSLTATPERVCVCVCVCVWSVCPRKL